MTARRIYDVDGKPFIPKNLKRPDLADVNQFLAHFGVKGMKWGVRKSASANSERSNSAAAIKDKERFDKLKSKLSSITSTVKLNKVLHPLAMEEDELKLNGQSYKNNGKTIQTELRLYKNLHLDDASWNKLPPSEKSETLILETTNDTGAYERNGVVESFGHTSTEVDNFLEHFGVKGMKWGVRRDPSGTHGGGLGPGYSKKQDKKIPAGTITQSVDAHGQKKYYQKQNDGTWRETYFSADQRALIKAQAKQPHELSTAELRAVTERKQALDNYNRLFNPNPEQKSQLELKVQRMELEKKYRDLNAQLNPPKENAIAKLEKKTAKYFGAFQKLDKVLGGQLSKGVQRRLGLEPQLTALEKIKKQNEFLNARKKHFELVKSLTDSGQYIDVADLHSSLIDAPSLTPVRRPGKHRKGGFPAGFHL